MVAARETRGAAATELGFAFDDLPGAYADRRQVRVKRLQAHAVIEDDAVAVDPQPTRMQHAAAVRRLNRGRGRRCEIEAEMDLVIDVVAVVDVGALIGEPGFDGRVDELLERALPEDLGRRFESESS